MVLVYLVNGECVEVEDAVSAESAGQRLHCLDKSARVVRTFTIDEISMFTGDPQTIDLMRDEVCADQEMPTAPHTIVR